jgi:aldehyde:ferredoxin oxidoreductase
MENNPVAALIVSENVCTVADSVGRCKGAVNAWGCALPLVWKYPLWEGLARLLNSATGLGFTPAVIQNAAERIYLVERAFNVRRGITRADDRLALTAEMKAGGKWAEEEKRHQELLSEYYDARGYDQKTGAPKKQVLMESGLTSVPDTPAAETAVPSWDGPPLWPLDRYPHGGRRV